MQKVAIPIPIYALNIKRSREKPWPDVANRNLKCEYDLNDVDFLQKYDTCRVFIEVLNNKFRFTVIWKGPNAFERIHFEHFEKRS